MKVKLTKEFDVLDGNGRVYHFTPGETFIDDSLLGTMLDKHLDAIHRDSITPMQDRVLTVKGSNAGINTAVHGAAMFDSNSVNEQEKEDEGEMPKTKQVDNPTLTGADSLVAKDSGTHLDSAGNVINDNATVTTPPLTAVGGAPKVVGKANPALITTADTTQAKVNQAAKNNSGSNSQANSGSTATTNGNGNKPAANKPTTSSNAGSSTDASGNTEESDTGSK